MAINAGSTDTQWMLGMHWVNLTDMLLRIQVD
jgi:hypothetical protein